MGASGDFIAQKVVEKKKWANYDWVRTGRFTALTGAYIVHFFTKYYTIVFFIRICGNKIFKEKGWYILWSKDYLKLVMADEVCIKQKTFQAPILVYWYRILERVHGSSLLVPLKRLVIDQVFRFEKFYL